LAEHVPAPAPDDRKNQAAFRLLYLNGNILKIFNPHICTAPHDGTETTKKRRGRWPAALN